MFGRINRYSSAMYAYNTMQLMPSNTVREDEFIQLAQKGYRVEVVCTESAYKQHANWYGRWVIRAFDEETGRGSEEVARASAVLVSSS